MDEASSPVDAPDLRDPRTLIGGRYAIALDSPLGAGGMCLVYRGQDTRTRREVAVKTLRLEYRGDPETRARFRREARLIAFLAHPNVIRVVDFIDDRGTSWVVLEHVPGRTVKELVTETGALPVDTVAHLLNQAAAALDHLHAQGLVHLDVKPQNLLVTASGDLKLIDFGLAQPMGRPQEAINGHTFGTLGYLAPEQLRGEPVDATADVYGLGAVVYELLTGAPPYPDAASGEATNRLIRTRLSQMPLPPTIANPAAGLPAWVDDVVLWALALAPGARYGSAAAFARVFRAGTDGEHPLPAPAPATLVEVPGTIIEPPAPPRPAPPGPAPASPDDEAPPPPSATAVTVPTHIGRARHVAAAPRPATALAAVQRWLWWAVAALLLLNLLVALLLLLTQGRLPGVVEPGLVMLGGLRPALLGAGQGGGTSDQRPP